MSKSNESASSRKSINLEESSAVQKASSSLSDDHTPFKDHLSDAEREKIEEVSAETTTLKKYKKAILEKEEAIKISVQKASSLGNNHTPFEDHLGDVEAMENIEEKSNAKTTSMKYNKTMLENEEAIKILVQKASSLGNDQTPFKEDNLSNVETMENIEEESNAETTSMKYKKTMLENEETKISPSKDLLIPENTMDKSNHETISKEEAGSSTKFIIKRKVNRRGSNFRAKKEGAIKFSVQKASSLGNHTPFEDHLGDVETMENIKEESNAETTSMKYKKTMLEREETKISPPEDLLIPENTMDESNHETTLKEAESSTKIIIKRKGRGSNFRTKGQFCKQNKNTLITKTMLEQEEMLEQEILKEEEQLQKKMLEQSKLEKEQGFKRLQHLLSRSGVYAKYLAEKLEQQEKDLAKKQEKDKQKQKHNLSKNQEQNGDPKSKAGAKRKAPHLTDASEVENAKNKKQKGPAQLNIRDYFTKEDLEKKALETTDLSHGYKESCTEDEVHEKQPKLFSGGVMRPYQIDGYEWLKVLYENGVNGILADEMGLGKTIQCIALISRLVEKNVPGPFFVCAPLSTLSNWVSEFRRFSPEIPVLLYHGDKAERMRLLTKIKKKVNVAGNLVHPVVITSYQIAIIERSKLARLEWKYLIIDEAHRIKNLHCRLVRELKQYNSLNRLLLTGTPLQNNLAELWSLLNFILPEIFDDLRVFESWFDISQLSKSEAAREIAAQEQEKQIISSIHQILTPFLLRRTKADITLLLPPKKELIVYAPLTSLQQQYYNAILNKTLELIAGVEKENKVEHEIDLSDDRPKRQRKEINYKECEEKYFISDDFVQESEDSSCNDVLPSIKTHHLEINMKNTMMMLRKACSHPYLISQPIDPETKDCLIDEDIVKSTGKVLVLDLMLPELKKRGHRVLLFSQFVIMLDLLAEYCELRDYKYLRYDGTMKILERDNNIREFNENKECFIFLISTRAGGLGINLASADTVIFYDSDWNPQSDLQAQDRCHRIGQTKPVIVYRLVTKNTIDQKMVERATAKRKLEKLIIQKGRFSTNDTLTKSQKAITQEELLELLQSSDVEGFVDTKDSIFAPGELEALLDRSDMITT